MRPKKEKKFYWSSGVTRDEVIQSLNDSRHSALHKQANRRWLVSLTAFSLSVMAFTTYIPQTKLRSYLDILLMAIVLVAYFKLRKSVRNVADAPDELLDERQISVRNTGYLHAYRYLATIGLVYFFFFYFLNETEFLKLTLGLESSSLTQVFFSYCMWSACLPSMVLAWLMPSENQN